MDVIYFILSLTSSWLMIHSVDSFLMTREDEIFLSQPNVRWFALHAVANFIIVCHSFRFVVEAILRPQFFAQPHALEKILSCFPTCLIDVSHITIYVPLAMVICIHAYHARYFSLRNEDKFHHMLFVCLMSIPSILLTDQFSHIINYVIFFICGLPGMCMYILLVCVKKNYVSSITEKRITMWLNNYVRMPMLLYGVFLGWTMIMNGYTNAFVSSFILSLVGYNAIYYNTESVITLSRALLK